jgi:hypothetical protein
MVGTIKATANITFTQRRSKIEISALPMTFQEKLVEGSFPGYGERYELSH